MDRRPTMYVMVGLPGMGKTTWARQLATEQLALRLTPDDWMLPLFAEPDAGGKRDVLEGRFVWLALRALALGVNVVMDFGLWGRDERSALRWLAREAGADCELVYLELSEQEQRHRVEDRFVTAPDATYDRRYFDLDQFRTMFQTPTRDELEGGPIDPPPEGFETWASWTADRWPTSFP